jgi:hypothetical protein
MDSKEFWRMIEAAREQADEDEEKQAALLVAALVALGESAIIAFGTCFKKYVDLAIDRGDITNTELVYEIRCEQWASAFSHWLVGQGESEYYRGLAANDAHDPDIVYSFGFWGTPLEYVFPTAYYECTGHDHPDWLGFSEFFLNTTNSTANDGGAVVPVSFEELEENDWGEPLLVVRDKLSAQIIKLSGDAFLLLEMIRNVYYQLPTWRQTTNSGILLVKAGNLMHDVKAFLDENEDDLRNALTMLVPGETLCDHEGATED